MSLPLLHLVQTRDGALLAPRYDMYVGPSLETYGEYSRDERELLDALLVPGNVVVQAGANIGALTIPLARRVGVRGRLLAFEPQRVMFRALVANLALTDAWHADAIAAAVGASEGMVSFPAVDYSRPGNFGGIAVSAEETPVKVPMTTIDKQVARYGLEVVHLVHLDVEGYELEALAGARETLLKHRPMVYAEIDRPAVREGLRGALPADYRLFSHAPLLGAAHAWRDPQTNIFVDTDTRYPLASHNALAVPAERVEELARLLERFGLEEFAA
jgi:FkbM family methyltransferase